MAANWQYGFPVTQVNGGSLEIYGSTNGTVGPYTHTVTFFPILPITGGGTVIVKLNGTSVATDDGNGNLTGASISSGSVNYVTGACTITFTTSQTTGTNNLTISYTASTINTTPTANDDMVFNLVETMIAAGWLVYGNSDGVTANNAAAGSPASQTLKWTSRGTPAAFTTIAAGSNNTNVATYTGAGVLSVLSNLGFTTTGTLIVQLSTNTFAGAPVVITYTGLGTNTFTGCTLVAGGGGSNSLQTGFNVQQQGSAGVVGNDYDWIRLRSPGTAGTTNGHEVLFYHGSQTGAWYIARSDTNFSGTFYTNVVGATSNGVNVNTFTGGGTLNTGTSVANFPAQGVLQVATSNGNQLVYYTGVSSTTFTGCQSPGSGTLSTGGSITSYWSMIWAPFAAGDQVGMFGSATIATPPLVTRAQYDNNTTSGTYHQEVAADANSPYGVYMFSFTKSPTSNSASFNAFVVDSLTAGSYNSLDTNPYWYFSNATASVLTTPTAANGSANFNGTQSNDVIPLPWPTNFQASVYTGKDDLFPAYYYGNTSASPVTYKGQGYYYYIDSFSTASRLPGTLLDIVNLNDTVVCNAWCFPWNLLALLLG